MNNGYHDIGPLQAKKCISIENSRCLEPENLLAITGIQRLVCIAALISSLGFTSYHILLSLALLLAMSGDSDTSVTQKEEIDRSTLLNAAMCYAIHSKNQKLLNDVLDKGADPNFLYVNESSKNRRKFTKALVHFYTYGMKAIEELKCGENFYL
nr:hypothetical protein HmN_000623200 [Hymenolepis microstoma]